MIFKLRIAHWRLTFSIAPVVDIIGVNSTLPDGNHIIMWDFDSVGLSLVSDVLRMVQEQFNLPNIYILNTGKLDHYIAYCFKRCTWTRSVEIVAASPFIDRNFFKYGVYREHWTLRVSPKETGRPKLVRTLYGAVEENCTIDELNSWTKYETLAEHAPMQMREIKIGAK